jgi:tetratricopeptide (TPR) repeat protein
MASTSEEVRGRSVGLLDLLLLFAATLTAHLPALQDLRWIGAGERDPAAHLWPGLAALQSLPESPRGTLVLRVVLALVLAFSGWLVAKILERGGARRWVALAGGAIAPLLPGSLGFLVDGSGTVLLFGWVALLVLIDRRLAAAGRFGPGAAVALAMAALATWLSKGALLPFALFAWFAANSDSARRTVLALVVGVACAAGLAALQVSGACHVGFGFGVDETLGTVADRASALAAFASGATLGWRLGGGLLLPPPFLSTVGPGGRVADLATFALVAAVALAITLFALWLRARSRAAQPFAARMPEPLFALGLGGLWLAPLTLGLVAAGWNVSVVPTALLPAAGGALTLAIVGPLRAVFQKSWRYGPIAPFVVPLAALVLVASPQQRRANAPAAALATQGGPWCAQVEFARSGQVDDYAQRVLDGASGRDWPDATLSRSALLVASAYQDRDAPEVALGFLEKFLADCAAQSARVSARVRGERLALVLQRQGPAAAALLLDAEMKEMRRDGGDPEYTSAVAEPLVDALIRSASNPEYVAIVLPMAERLLERVATNPPAASAGELLSLALLRTGQGRLVDAVKLAELAVSKAPKSARPHLVLARIYLAQDERTAGAKHVAIARRIDPQDPAALFLEGRLYAGTAEYAESGVTKMLDALKQAPQLPGAREDFDDAMGRATAALIAGGKAAQAQTLLQRAVDAMGRRPALVHEFGRVAMTRRDFEAAVAAFDEARVPVPDRADWKRDLVEALRDSGYAHLVLAQKKKGDEANAEHALAVARFERALALAPPDFETGGMKLVVEGAHRDRDPDADQNAGAPRAAFDGASRLYQAGDKAGAKAAFEKSLEAVPLNPLAHMNLGRIELELGDAKAAESRLRTAIAIGQSKDLPVEDAYPLLLRALDAQLPADPKLAAKRKAVVEEYLRLFPEGRHRKAFEKERDS